MGIRGIKPLIVLCTLGVAAFSQIQLSGTITNASGEGIEEVEASLPEYGVKAVSDSNGQFSLLAVGQASSIRNYAPQSNAINTDESYRIFVPNGARRLLPYSALNTLRDGIYYLVPGRSYRAELKIVVMGGEVVSKQNIREPVMGDTQGKQLRKASTNTDLVLVRPGVVDTTISLNPTQHTLTLQLPPAQGSLGKMPTGSFTDTRDGVVYPTIVIGNQEWFAENLRYVPGDGIGSWCPQGLPDDCSGGFGRFYNWNTAMANDTANTSGRIRGVCPAGWRVPSDDDWKALERNIGMSSAAADSVNWRGSPYGKALKSASAYWLTGTQTNESGFQAVPAGFWNTPKLKREYFGAGTFLWSSTKAPDSSARARVLLAAKDGIYSGVYPRGMGMGVRCFNDSVDANGNFISPIQGGAGYVIWEKWKHIRGTSLNTVQWTSAPNDTGRWDKLQSPSDFDDRFGLRIRGYITAPYTGSYTFMSLSNGTTEFWLSTNQATSNVVKIISASNTQSTTVNLERGKRYYFTSYWKENWQPDSFTVAWLTPQDPPGASFTPIPSEWLSPAERSTYKVLPAACQTITPTAPDSAWPAYCREKTGNCGTFIDERDCREYRWTQIGTQKWMAENLNYGTRIDGALDMTNDTVVEKYCYNNLDSMCNVYGGLYQWHELYLGTFSPNDKKAQNTICPAGWTMPEDQDWNSLFNFLGDSLNLGSELKSHQYWVGNFTSTDAIGFTAIPSGDRWSTNKFGSLGFYATWWSTFLEERGPITVVRLVSSNNSYQVLKTQSTSTIGFSIRCTLNK